MLGLLAAGMANQQIARELVVAVETAASEVSASLDLLRASLAIAVRHGHHLDPRVFVTGFSQGGQAAMALARALQDAADPRLGLGALAPVSGTYDVAHAELPAMFSGQIAPSPRAAGRCAVGACPVTHTSGCTARDVPAGSARRSYPFSIPLYNRRADSSPGGWVRTDG